MITGMNKLGSILKEAVMDYFKVLPPEFAWRE
jgi:hypothetical protein